MRKVVGAIAILLIASSAYAEVQNVQVGGEIRIRGRFWNNVYERNINSPPRIRIPAFFVPRRPIGPFGVRSRYDFDNARANLDFVEQRTRLNVNADFTNDVRAFIELESYDHWGEDFRSIYQTGLDTRAVTNNDVEIYQAYIEANEMYGYPIRLRIGRQEMKLGKGWLIDDITTAIWGRSWDMIRVTYETDPFVIDAWWSIIGEETASGEEDGDVTFAGVYGTYKALEMVDISAYWMWIRDARRLNDTNFIAPLEWVEDILGFDDYDVTNMHTVGIRAFGATGALDYDLELAYQFGEADHVGFGFKPFGLYGDDGADYDSWAADLEVGYTLAEVPWSPRIFAGIAYFDGEDNRDLDFWEWANPFNGSEASVSFNRLFPGKPYSPVLEIGQDMSNFWTARVGVVLHPSDSVTAKFKVAYFEVDEPFDWPIYFNVGDFRILTAPALSFLTEEAAVDIGWTATSVVTYHYSEDLLFRLVWEHFWPGEGIEDGSFVHRYGLEFTGGTDTDGADYIHLETQIKF